MKTYLSIFAIFLFAGLNYLCNSSSISETSKPEYASLNDSTKYVGKEKCLACHADKSTYLETGMGLSFDSATQKKSIANFNNSTIKDKENDLNYFAFWENGKEKLKEFRLQGKDTVFTRTETTSFIIGSGHHTNSHLLNTNGYLTQMPFTFYSQKGLWDLPPGFENGKNSRFERKIGLECMTCHNAYPKMVIGSENKYEKIQNGIDCERCHGPGQKHIDQFIAGKRIDTAKYIDYSIVNPSKLPIDLQFDVCQRCHLQGNAVLTKDKSFFDFKPGMKLNSVISIFLPKYEHGDEQFIMASHADRLKQTKCFLVSNKKSEAINKNSLKPFKNGLTCVTCHNPHQTVKKVGAEIFNTICKNCHKNDSHLKKEKKYKNCISCHMPNSGSIDIPHVSIHDHYIRKPISNEKKEGIRKFIGLRSVNNSSPSNLEFASAYLNQFEKFDPNTYLLDSALNRLKKCKDDKELVFSEMVRAYFLKNDFEKVVKLVSENKCENVLNSYLIKINYENKDAWTAYRIGESYSNMNLLEEALKFYKKAISLANYNLEFQNKLSSAYLILNRYEEAQERLLFILNENPNNVQANLNLGFLKLLGKDPETANKYYQKAISLDPDNEQTLMNLAGLYIFKGQFKMAKYYLKEVLKRNPKNKKASNLLTSQELS